MRIAANSSDMHKPSAVEMMIQALWSVVVMVENGGDCPGGTIGSKSGILSS